MVESSPLFDRPNVALVGALAGVFIVVAAVTLGPVRERLASTHSDIEAYQQKISGWNDVRHRVKRVSGAERERWARQWEALVSRTPPVGDGSELVARLARAVQAPSVRRVEIDAVRPGRDGPQPLHLEAKSPVGEETLEILGNPVRVRFVASYADVKLLLERIDRRELPARIESLELRRQLGDVAVDLVLTVFGRVEVAT